jgi:hypothetical protein
MKSPHSQRPDDEAREQTEEFIAKYAKDNSPVAGAKQVEPRAEAAEDRQA